jgi:SAM-dependent methyltransferase
LTADGSPVELYRLLKPLGEPELIQVALSPGSSILELGCGVGRITHPLLQMGFNVVAVDNSPDMLEFVEGAEKVAADIETLNLEREFDAVLLMSHFVNVPDASLRESLLATCRRHLAPHGVAIIQRHDPNWLESAEVGFVGDRTGVDAFLDSVIRRGAEVEMTIRWEAGGKTGVNPSQRETLTRTRSTAHLQQWD